MMLEVCKGPLADDSVRVVFLSLRSRYKVTDTEPCAYWYGSTSAEGVQPHTGTRTRARIFDISY